MHSVSKRQVCERQTLCFEKSTIVPHYNTHRSHWWDRTDYLVVWAYEMHTVSINPWQRDNFTIKISFELCIFHKRCGTRVPVCYSWFTTILSPQITQSLQQSCPSHKSQITTFLSEKKALHHRHTQEVDGSVSKHKLQQSCQCESVTVYNNPVSVNQS